jgi:predicted HTH transcriptional regulator
LLQAPEDENLEFSESDPDFSEEICAAATLDDLAPEAIGRFREMWQKKSGNPALANLERLRLLEDAELVLEGSVTYAALVLLGLNAVCHRDYHRLSYGSGRERSKS